MEKGRIAILLLGVRVKMFAENAIKTLYGVSIVWRSHPSEKDK